MKLSRSRYFWRFVPLIWLPVLVIWPLMTFNQGTSSGIEVETLSVPYRGGDKLRYKWTGDVTRSCQITLRRHIIDSKGYVRSLKPTTFPPLPADELGHVSYQITVDTPDDLPLGETTYSVDEYPECSWLQRLIPRPHPYPDVVFVVTR